MTVMASSAALLVCCVCVKSEQKTCETSRWQNGDGFLSLGSLTTCGRGSTLEVGRMLCNWYNIVINHRLYAVTHLLVGLHARWYGRPSVGSHRAQHDAMGEGGRIPFEQDS